MTQTPHLASSESLPALEPFAVEPVKEAEPPTEIISETETQDKHTETNAFGKDSENRNTDSQLNSVADTFKSPVWITWTGFYSIWFFWVMCCFSTFLAFEVILGTLGGGVIGKYKLEVLGYKFPVKHLLSGVFAGSLEVGSLAATWLTRRHEETEE